MWQAQSWLGRFQRFFCRGILGIPAKISYSRLLAPPSAVFPVVWGILYALMGISAYLVYTGSEDDSTLRRTALGLYIAQLAVNFSWSIIFFRFRAFTAAAVAVLLALLVFRYDSGICQSNASKPAAWLNVPYLLWSIFAAAYLAIGTALLN